MGKIVVSENVTLDGVIQDPAGEEGFRPAAGSARSRDRDSAKAGARGGAGRRGPAAGAAQLRVVRRAVAVPQRRVGGQVERSAQVRRVLDPRTSRLEQLHGARGRGGDRGLDAAGSELDGDIVVPASFQLVRTLMEHDLVDELRLKIYPVVLGAGERLFGGTRGEKSMRLVDSQTVEGGIAVLTYERVRSV